MIDILGVGRMGALSNDFESQLTTGKVSERPAIARANLFALSIALVKISIVRSRQPAKAQL